MVQNAGFLLKNGQNKRRKKLEKVAFTHFTTRFFARTEWKFARVCKNKSNLFKFGIGDFL